MGYIPLTIAAACYAWEAALLAIQGRYYVAGAFLCWAVANFLLVAGTSK